MPMKRIAIYASLFLGALMLKICSVGAIEWLFTVSSIESSLYLESIH